QRHHLVLAHAERDVAQRLEHLAVRQPEPLGHSARLEQQRAGGHAASEKRACAHCISDRHTRRFHPTTIRLISAIPPARSGKLACAVASLIRLPNPLVVRNVPPASMYSATIDPFHAPPAAVTQPVTRAGNAAGRYSARQRARRGRRNAAARSL